MNQVRLSSLTGTFAVPIVHIPIRSYYSSNDIEAGEIPAGKGYFANLSGRPSGSRASRTSLYCDYYTISLDNNLCKTTALY